ncbi:CST complex subunit CTC1 [Diretmus argenteus]
MTGPTNTGGSGVCVSQPGVWDSQPGVCDSQPSVCDSQPGVCDSQPSVCDSQPGVWDSQPGVCDSQPSVCDSQPGVCDSQPSVCDSQPGVCDSQPSVCDSQPVVCVSTLSVCVVRKIQEMMGAKHTLPLSYRLVSVSELVATQRVACVSNLSWSTNQHRAWVREVEQALPNHKTLPRENLLLIGCLREGQGGEWRLTDASGSVNCECLSPSPLWRNRPFFFPHWNYIPHNAVGHNQKETEGYIELIGCPLPLSPGPELGFAVGPGGAELSRVFGVREAAAFLHNRTRGVHLTVCGSVCSVCPLLVISDSTFFCFRLRDDTHTLPVLVKDPGSLWWRQCVCVGQSVCVTALRVYVLRGWRGGSLLCVTSQSALHTHTGTHTTHTQQHTHTPVEDTHVDTPLLSHDDAPEEAEPERDIVQSAVRIKQSRVISYQGVVTEVLSEGAGLYVIDKKVGLCLAYQPPLKRKLRPGDSVELHDVHFLYRPCPDFTPSMLCACLRSSLRVTTFSRVADSGSELSCRGDRALPRLLLEKNVGVAEYLWICHVTRRLRQSLVPSLLKEVCVLAWKLMECVWRGRGKREKRNIYSEMLDEPHACLLTQSACWSGVCLDSLLPSGGTSLTRSQINAALAWSYLTQCTPTSDPQHQPHPGEQHRRRPLVLVGILELPTHTPSHTSSHIPSHTSEHTLQLRDRTGIVACVVTETNQEEEGGQRAAFNTAWIGCLVCVQQFTMVTERFLQSDFPSYKHLEQDRYITRKQCRVYLQFSLDDVHILRPSEEKEEEEEESAERATQGLSHPTSCVSVVIMVEQKEGMAWRNVGIGLKDKEAGLSLCFNIIAAVIGPVVRWRQNPKNRRMMDRETEREKNNKVDLLFVGLSVRWFPLLHPGCYYRLVAANTQDPSVLIGCGVAGRRGVELHTNTSLKVCTDWRFHTLTRPLLPQYNQSLSHRVMSVSEVLDCRSVELVCFQGLVSERISVNSENDNAGHTNTNVRLTVCDQSGRSIHVYLDLSRTPYPHGLLPGNTLLLSAFQRRLSRSGSVYCSPVTVSSVTVITLGDACSAKPPAPMMHLGQWTLCEEKRSIVGRVRAHVVCVLSLQLQWSCSLCNGIYRQSGCSSSPQCGSTSSVFQAKAKLLVEDGTGEAHIWFSCPLVRPLLGLADSQWEGLQRALRVRGHIRVYPRGQSLVCDSGSDDPLLQFLQCVCSSDAMCRVLSLTCRTHTHMQRSEDEKMFSRGEIEFMTKMNPPLQLTCLRIETD